MDDDEIPSGSRLGSASAGDGPEQREGPLGGRSYPAADIADHGGFTELESEDRDRVDAGVHASDDDGPPSRQHGEAGDVACFGEFAVPADELVDGGVEAEVGHGVL